MAYLPRLNVCDVVRKLLLLLVYHSFLVDETGPLHHERVSWLAYIVPPWLAAGATSLTHLLIWATIIHESVDLFMFGLKGRAF